MQNPATAELVDLVNKKINFIISQLDVDGEHGASDGHAIHHVSISACGIAFCCDEFFSQGQLLHLQLLLKPRELHVATLARVVACELLDEPLDEGKHYLRLSFEGVNLSDEELLIQHVIHRQSEMLKAK